MAGIVSKYVTASVIWVLFCGFFFKKEEREKRREEKRRMGNVKMETRKEGPSPPSLLTGRALKSNVNL